MTNAKINITAIKAFSDNYIWAIGSSSSSTVALVDPGDAKACIEYLKAKNLSLNTILITHHHHDHTGGIKQLRQYCQQQGWTLTVYGPALEALNDCDIPLSENDTVELSALNTSFKVIDLPGHTKGHIAYVNNDVLFCGDVLFSGGCGRIMEGTPSQMYQSLEKLAALPDSIKVYCAHEYTLANLTFALTVDPENHDLVDYFNNTSNLRSQNIATIPTDIATEKKINPFLRSISPALVNSAEDYTNKKVAAGLNTFTVIREWKNNF